MIYPDGRFGCCVFPGNREHRRRIFALAGERRRQPIKVRMAPTRPSGPILSGILGRLGRLFPSPKKNPTARDGWDGVTEVEMRSTGAGTPGTGESNSGGKVGPTADPPGTPGTGSAKSKRGSRVEPPHALSRGKASSNFQKRTLLVILGPAQNTGS
jgi:hypothetical protein